MKSMLGHNRIPFVLLAAMIIAWPFGALAFSEDTPQVIAVALGFPAMLVMLLALAIWVYLGWKGMYILYKKGYFGANIGWLGFVLLLLFGWWFVIIVWELGSIAGAFLYRYAMNKPAKPRCPACKTLNAPGATRCRACTSEL